MATKISYLSQYVHTSHGKNIIQKCTYPTIQDKNGYDITGNDISSAICLILF